MHRSLHENLESGEEAMLSDALKHDGELQEEKRKLLELRDVLRSQDFRFKPFFSSRVMKEIDVTRQPLGLLSSINYAFMRVSLPTMVAVFIWILTFWGTEGSLSLDGLLGVAGLSYDEIVNEYLVSN
ncbi:MAG: hypothetical protein R8P61_10545 [Bacteroidia bacterium]|nr:hypothetical protein [Bacteroidia bacterium]